MPAKLFGAAAVIFGTLAAIFQLLASAQTRADTAGVRLWFEKRWHAVKQTRYRDLPERLVAWLLLGRRRLASAVISADRKLAWLWMTVPGMLIMHRACDTNSSYVYASIDRLTFSDFAAATVIVFFPVVRQIYTNRELRRNVQRGRDRTFNLELSRWLIRSTLSALVSVVILASAFAAPQRSSPILLLLLLPLFTVVWSFSNITWRDARQQAGETALLFSTAVGASFLITQIALLLGHVLAPAADVPQTMQMYVANALCDGVAVTATLLVLEWATAGANAFRLPVAVLLIITLALILSGLSLWLGVAFTDAAVNLRETANILIARTRTGTCCEAGPLFWAMHTVFLPTAAFVGLLSVASMAKGVSAVALWYFGKGKDEDINAYALTAGLLGLIGMACAVLALLVGVSS